MGTTEVVVGRIGKPHGITGEVSVELRTDEPARRFADGAVLGTRTPRGTEPHGLGRPASMTVQRTRWHQSRLLVPFAEVPDRTAAEAVRGLTLVTDVDVSVTPEDPEEFYDHQLVGLAVVTTEGSPVGEVVEAGPRRRPGPARRSDADERDALVPVRRRRWCRWSTCPAAHRGRGPARAATAPRDLTTPAAPRIGDGRARRHRLDLSRLPRPLGLSLPGRAQDARPARRPGPRPARLDPRPAPDRRRHAVRRRGRHGDEARAVGRGARRAGLEARPTRCSSCPHPPGERFTQAVAAELATRGHLVFACGRYEGIDQRVLDDATGRMRGARAVDRRLRAQRGEAAALAIIEAVVRLLPGFLGNPESLAEESHGDSGLLEYPVYTKPAAWRGHEVPAVLRSGDHGRVAAWRHDQAVRRTAARRPDLLHPSQLSRRGRRRGPADPRGRRRGAHSSAGLLGHRGPRQPRRAHPAADRGSRRRPRLAGGPDHLRGPLRSAARRCSPVPPRGRRLGHRPADGGARPARTRARAVAAGVRRAGRPARRQSRTSCSPGLGASATCGCTASRLPPRPCPARGRRRRAPEPSGPASPVRLARFRRRSASVANLTLASVASRPLVLTGGGSAGHLPQGAFRTTQPADHEQHDDSTRDPRSVGDLWRPRGDHHDQRHRPARRRHAARRHPRIPRRRHRQGARQGRRGQPLARPGLPGRRASASRARASAAPSPSARSPSASASSAPSRCTRRSSTGSRSSPAVTSAARSSTTCATCAARLPRSRRSGTPHPAADLATALLLPAPG